MNINQGIFKAYDIRGVVGSEITAQEAFYIGKAYAQVINPNPRIVAVGRDVRVHGRELQEMVIAGLQSEGIKVVDIGVISTDMLYFAVGHYGYGGGITVSASHNPAEYNGFKMVRDKAQAISFETGIKEIYDRIQNVFKGDELQSLQVESVETNETLVDDYIDFLGTFVDLNAIRKAKDLTIAFNGNHGITGNIFERMVRKLELPFATAGLFMEPDGTFPQGRPDPMYPKNQEDFQNIIIQSSSNFGCAVDADADRCFFFTQSGKFIDGYYTTAILAQSVLAKYPNTKIVHDPRLTWAVIDLVKKVGGTPLVNKVGHSFIKKRMKDEDAAFGGENSGHYYFKDFFYADSGLLGFLLFLEYYVISGVNLDDLLEWYQVHFPISGEINTKVADADVVLSKIKEYYTDAKLEFIDGISLEYPDWRCNVRKSNTEPLVRLNVEAKTKELVDVKVAELLHFIQ